MSDTKNVKLGVCKVFFDGKDLGYTQGGVEVTVATQTHKVNVDQFGKSIINEYILGRDVMVKVPLAETTLDNLVSIMPGAVLITDSVKATGSLTLTAQPTNGQTVLINGKTLTFKTVASVVHDVTIGATVAASAQALASVLSSSIDLAVSVAGYVVVGAVIGVTYGVRGVIGNTFALAVGTAAATVSGALLTGGSDGLFARVEVTNAIGVDLLAISKELRLHPKSRLDSDKSEDFVIPLAATPGALKFAYKLENERLYDCDFTGYPDPSTGRLFFVGA